MTNQLRQVAPHQRLSAAEAELKATHLREVVDQPRNLERRQLVGKRLARRGETVPTTKIAGVGDREMHQGRRAECTLDRDGVQKSAGEPPPHIENVDLLAEFVEYVQACPVEV